MNPKCRRFAHTVRFLAHCALASAFCVGIGVVQAPAATVTVTGTADGTLAELDGNGTCDLREAIEASNTDTAIGECAAGSGKDMIAFSIGEGGLQTIRPLTGLPTITDPVVIDGTTQPGCGDTPCIEISGSSFNSWTNGLTIAAGDSTIRGLVINSFKGNGVHILSKGGNHIEGCYIGTDVTGTRQRSNWVSGVRIDNSSNNTVGGFSSLTRNVVSGNGYAPTGPSVCKSYYEGVGISVSGDNNRILGNYIGTDASGTVALGNLDVGVFLGGRSNTLGGSHQMVSNVVSGNGAGTDHGIGVRVSGLGLHVIQGNFIGTDATGTRALGNNRTGIVVSGAPNSSIGGLEPGEANIIAFNKGAGVSARIVKQFLPPDLPSPTSVRIVGNAIFENTEQGIDLVSQGNPPICSYDWLDGITFNDDYDLDSGPNLLQNYPVLEDAVRYGSEIAIAGYLESTESSDFTLHFYSNTQPGPFGRGEGRTYLGEHIVRTHGGGWNRFITPPIKAPADEGFITATATDSLGNTSEFSAAIAVKHPLQEGEIITVTGTADGALWELEGNGTCDLREAIYAANDNYAVNECPAGSGRDRIFFNIEVSGRPVIVAKFGSFSAREPLILDGTTQPGCESWPCVGIVNGIKSGTGISLLTGHSVVRGLEIDGFSTGVELELLGGHVIESNSIINCETGIKVASSGNLVGGTMPGTGNTVFGSSGPGVVVQRENVWHYHDARNINNRIVGNAIFDNGGMGIDLVSDDDAHTVTPNDQLDSDFGPNNLQNFPVLATAARYGDRIIITGRVESTPNTEFEIDFYANEHVDASGHGEGETYLGQTTGSTDGFGGGIFHASFPFASGGLRFITATAADPVGNTSEFSEAIEIVVADPIALPDGPKPKKLNRAERKAGVIRR